MSDKDKQLLLAQKRAVLRKKAVTAGERLKVPPEEKPIKNESEFQKAQYKMFNMLLFNLSRCYMESQ